jgi:hypothetical protein
LVVVFSATVAIRVDGEGLLPSVSFCVQTRYQLNSHLQSNTLELDDKAQTLSYEHYYPYGGTAIIAGKDKL